MPERLDDITVEELSLVPKGAHPGTDFVPLSKSAENEPVEEEITDDLKKSHAEAEKLVKDAFGEEAKAEPASEQVGDLLKDGFDNLVTSHLLRKSGKSPQPHEVQQLWAHLAAHHEFTEQAGKLMSTALGKGAITPDEVREIIANQQPVDLAKSFIDGIDGLTKEQLNAVADAILAKTADEDMPEEEGDPLNDRMDRMEKAIAAVTDELAKSHSEILERLEKSSEKQVPEPVAPEPEVNPTLAKGVDSLLEKLAKLEGQFRNVEARAKAALGEDPGEI